MFFRNVLSLYSPAFVATLVTEMEAKGYSGWRLLNWFWHAKSYELKRPVNEMQRSLSVFLGLLMLLQVAIGVGFLVEWARFGTAGALEFGVATLIVYPIFWAHVVVVFAWAWNILWAIMHPKKAGNKFVSGIFEWQVRQLRARHHFKVVAVVGSVGKTSTKLAIANLLGQTMRVRHQTGNYNARLTVPLVFFGLEEPNIYNVFAWIKAFGVSQSEISLPFPYDVVVVELGTDGPGQLKEFAYLKPDIAVVTAVSPEHMEFFDGLDGVAAEELSVFDFAKQVLVNGDDIAGEYLAGRDFKEYSLTSKQAQYRAKPTPHGMVGQKLDVHLGKHEFKSDINFLGDQGAKITLAAAAVANLLGVKKSDIEKGLSELMPFSGRMQVLPGIKDSTIIDDTYNASPLAVKAALDVLYASKAKQRIAILGGMNELGDYSRDAHDEIGQYCDKKKVDVVVTIGKDAKKWLAPAAREKGCTVQAFDSPYDAGAYVSGKLKEGAVVLAKGSQNGVFAEEALKPLLANPVDAAKLVRQSDYWLKRKKEQFPN